MTLLNYLKLTCLFSGIAFAFQNQNCGTNTCLFNTGTFTDLNGTVDGGWSIIQNSIAGESIDLTGGGAETPIVTKVAAGWAVTQKSLWIAPNADQSSGTGGTRQNSCCTGSTTYEYQFVVSDTSIKFNMLIYADDSATVKLNNTVIYQSTDLISAKGVGLSISGGLHSGLNSIDIVVSNSQQGGPTGLNVTFLPFQAAGSGPTSSRRNLFDVDSMSEPIDSATGQLYNTETDLKLGGPMQVGFQRYYGSQLTNTIASTSLGPNWMSNFDVSATVSGTTANVVMMGGLLLTFTNSGGKWQLTSPLQTVYQFIQNGTSYQLLDPTTKWVYTFSSAGALTQISNRRGDSILVTQGPNGPAKVADSLGRTIAFTYTGSNLTQLTDQAGRTVTFSYSNGVLASAVDIYNQTTKYAYSTGGLLTKETLPLGNSPVTQIFDSSNRAISQTDGTNDLSKLAYDGNGGTSVTDPLGNVRKFVSNADGSTAQFSDPLGGAASMTYDNFGRRVSLTDKLGNKTSLTYEPNTGYLASITDALGNTTTYTYIAQSQDGFTYYNISGISYPDGTSSAMTYDIVGDMLTLKAKDGTTRAFTYDSNGRVTSITNAAGQKSTYTWNADSTMASMQDAAGNVTTFTYDNLKRVVSQTDPNGGKTGFIYDKSTTGPMYVISPPGLAGTALNDDQNRQLSTVVPPSGGVFKSTYTANGDLATYTDPSSNQTAYSYDSNRNLSSITNGAGDKMTFTRDALGRVLTIADANGTRSTYTYTAESEIATETDGTGRKTSYTYDALGRQTAFQTALGNIYKTGWDKNGRVISRTDPLNGAETITRDGFGRSLSITMPGGIATTLKRDAMGSVTSLTSPNGNAWTYAYDALERPSKSTDPLGNATTFTYTGSQLTGMTMPLGSVNITRNGINRITKLAYSDGATMNYTYDNNGFIASADAFSVTRNNAYQPTNINGIAITYDAANRPATLTYAAGKTISYTYDSSGRLASVSDWVNGKTTFTYDGAGRMLTMTAPNGVTTTQSYDGDGELIKIASGSLGSITLTRDALGNITSADRSLPTAPVLTAATQQFTYDAAGELTSATADAMGRVTSQNGRTYTWNLANHLTGFSDGVNKGQFLYDALGEMMASTASGAQENFIFNYLFPLPTLTTVKKNGSDLRYYVYAPNGTLLYSIEAAGNARHFYHFDEMGNTTFLTDDSGAVSDSYAITPYGEIATHTGTMENPFTWQGQFGVMQEGQGLYYVRMRHYDASAARFLSRDPIKNADPRSGEPHVYAAGNPLRFIDPMGTSSSLPNLDLPPLPKKSPMSAADAEAFATDFALELYNDLTIVKQAITSAQDAGADARTNISFAVLLNAKAQFEEVALEVATNPDLNWLSYAQQNGYPLPTGYVPPQPKPAVTPSKPKQPASGSTAGSSGGSASGGLKNTTSTSTGSSGSGGLLASNACAGLQPNPSVTTYNPPPAVLYQSNGTGLISQDGSGIISQDGSGLISQDGSGLISQDGSGVISNDGGS